METHQSNDSGSCPSAGYDVQVIGQVELQEENSYQIPSVLSEHSNMAQMEQVIQIPKVGVCYCASPITPCTSMESSA